MDNEFKLPQDAQKLHDALANLIQDAGVLSRELTAGWQLLKRGEKPESDSFSFLPRYSPPSVAEVLLGPQWPPIIRGLRKTVPEFLRQWTAVESALYGLPAATLAKLDAMDSPGWKDRLRRTLDKLLEWPLFKEACKSGSLGVEILVVALELCGPPDWKEEIQHLTKSKNDLYALRGPTPAREDKLPSIIESPYVKLAVDTKADADNGQTMEVDKDFPAPKESSPDQSDEQLAYRLLSVLTNGLADERVDRAAIVLNDKSLTANEKLTKIDAVIPLPATASAEQLGQLLGVTKQAVMKTNWWIEHRKGENANEIRRRQSVHKERAKQYEVKRSHDEEE